MFNRFVVALLCAFAGTLLLFVFTFIWFPSVIETAIQQVMPWLLLLSEKQRRIVAYVIQGGALALGPAILFGITAYRIQRARRHQAQLDRSLN
jgi:hypothetical protein